MLHFKRARNTMENILATGEGRKTPELRPLTPHDRMTVDWTGTADENPPHHHHPARV